MLGYSRPRSADRGGRSTTDFMILENRKEGERRTGEEREVEREQNNIFILRRN